MRPILSATGTYNYNLAKWLENKLKPSSINEYTITDALLFSQDIRIFPVKLNDILVSYDVCAFLTNVPLKKTIDINKASENNWFNKTYNLSIQRHQLTKLLEISTMN